ncbi:NAD(P)-dependent oxidoreductase [bacterium]|nr:NAD(P)-dependent oxidoreductase [bacterium]
MLDKLSDKSVLVTGATGFIGTNLVHALAPKGIALHALVRPTSDPSRINELSSYAKLHYADLRDQTTLESIVSAIDPNYILHLAATPDHSQTLSQCREALETSILGTFNLLQAASSLKHLKKVIVAGSLLTDSYSQVASAELISFRSIPKSSERMLATWLAQNLKLPVLVLLIARAYGPFEKVTRFVPQLINAHIRNQVLELTAEPCFRDFIHTDDLSQAFLQAMTVETTPGAIFELGSGQLTSTHAVVQQFEKLIGCEVKKHPGKYPQLQALMHTHAANITETCRILNWSPQVDLSAGLSKTFEWYKNEWHKNNPTF